jgi:hypothetical protein
MTQDRTGCHHQCVVKRQMDFPARTRRPDHVPFIFLHTGDKKARIGCLHTDDYTRRAHKRSRTWPPPPVRTRRLRPRARLPRSGAHVSGPHPGPTLAPHAFPTTERPRAPHPCDETKEKKETRMDARALCEPPGPRVTEGEQGKAGGPRRGSSFPLSSIRLLRHPCRGHPLRLFPPPQRWCTTAHGGPRPPTRPPAWAPSPLNLLRIS